MNVNLSPGKIDKMGRVNRKNTFYDKRTHFEKHKNEHKPINNKQLHKHASDRPKKNKPI